MAKFHNAKPLRLLIKGASTSVIPNPQGIPVAVSTPAKMVNIPQGVYETKDPEIIEKIRSDVYFGTQNGMIEITEEEQEAISIREAKMREADEEIKARKKSKQK